MVQQLFEAFFVVSLVGLVSAPVVGLLLLAWPQRKVGQRVVGARQVQARV